MYFLLKTIHIISASILFGTGIGIAFFMFRSLFTHDISQKYYAVSNTVLADYLFTLPAVILQVVSGILLLQKTGYAWNSQWLLMSYGFYLLAALCWLPVVWIQIKLKKILAYHIEHKIPFSVKAHPQYQLLFRIWFILGWPAFISLVAIFYLMVQKPT